MDEVEISVKKEQGKTFLEKLKGLFSSEKTITALRINNGYQTFLVRNPEKIKYWKTLAERQGTAAFNKGSSIGINILEVQYGTDCSERKI